MDRLQQQQQLQHQQQLQQSHHVQPPMPHYQQQDMPFRIDPGVPFREPRDPHSNSVETMSLPPQALYPSQQSAAVSLPRTSSADWSTLSSGGSFSAAFPPSPRSPSSLHRRGGSMRSRSSQASYASRASVTSGNSLANDTAAVSRSHRRSRSDASVISIMSYTGSEVVAPEELSEEPVLFVSPPPKNLICMICEQVFSDPVIAKCGHTFCRMCVMNTPPGGVCPMHQQSLSKNNVISNLTVVEQINELDVYCKYGLKQATEGEPGGYERDPDGCTHVVRLGDRRHHESTCPYAPVACPNSALCEKVLQRDLEDHLRTCERYSCSHKARGCEFEGTQENLQEHLKSCKFESVKELLQESDARLSLLAQDAESKDQEIGFLRSMLAKLSERLERMETLFEMRVDGLDENFTRLSEDLRETMRSVNDTQTEVSAIQSKLGLVDGDIDLLSASHMFKCKGTFVGHQGPVWALAVAGDLLFSGSSDETIKVWDTSTSFKCKRTLQAHRGIVHALCTHNHKLYSGSSDCTVKMWDIDTLELEETLEGHDNPVCTLAIANGLLFSGSLKNIKIWDLHSRQPIAKLTELNHWVRALVATEHLVAAGSYQTISIWTADPTALLETSGAPPKLQQLRTSGGSVYSLCVSEDFVIAGTYENLIHVWDIRTFEEVATLEGHGGTVYSLVLMSHGGGKGRLFSASYDKTIKVWSLDTFSCLQTLLRHQNSVDALVVQRGRLFSGAADSTVKVWQ
eukprot:m.483093 g.483093  ORF g.483093 m.483093 type:complete len:741 (-) comp22779_c0_seq1:113-2335(-)